MKWILRLSPVLFFIGFAGYTSVFRISKNFHEVEPGLLYRSAQLFPGELKDAINAYGFKTVVSLRGSPPVLLNMENEEIILKGMNVVFYKFDLEEDFFPSRQDLLGLIEVLKNAPRPILIHCRSGADRTGMVAALFELEEMKKPKAEALKQLSFNFWHVRSIHPAMTEFVRIYGGEDWAKSQYNPCKYPSYFKSAECKK